MRRPIYQNSTFRLGKNIHLNACVGYNGFPNIHTYQLGYYKATIALIESANKNSYDADALVYPIVFSARHAIELFLKKQLREWGHPLKVRSSKSKWGQVYC